MGARDSGVRVSGLREMVKGLEAAGIAVADLKAVFGEISADAAKLATSYAPSKSGKLAKSIKGSKTKNRASVSAGRARIPYAGPLNYGWRARNIEPHHFMQKADEAIKPTLQPRIETAIGQLLQDNGLA